MQQHYITRIISGLLIFLFVYTGVSKILQFHFFAAQLQLYPLLSKAPVLIAVTVPAGELIVAMLLCANRTMLNGLYASLVLLLLFTFYLLIMVLTQPGLPCTCGGVISSMSWQQHILFNLLFTGLCVIAIYYKRKAAS